jgi:hypothetical protein
LFAGKQFTVFGGAQKESIATQTHVPSKRGHVSYSKRQYDAATIQFERSDSLDDHAWPDVDELAEVLNVATRVLRPSYRARSLGRELRMAGIHGFGVGTGS